MIVAHSIFSRLEDDNMFFSSATLRPGRGGCIIRGSEMPEESDLGYYQVTLHWGAVKSLGQMFVGPNTVCPAMARPIMPMRMAME